MPPRTTYAEISARGSVDRPLRRQELLRGAATQVGFRRLRNGRVRPLTAPWSVSQVRSGSSHSDNLLIRRSSSTDCLDSSRRSVVIKNNTTLSEININNVTKIPMAKLLLAWTAVAATEPISNTIICTEVVVLEIMWARTPLYSASKICIFWNCSISAIVTPACFVGRVARSVPISSILVAISSRPNRAWNKGAA